MKLQALNRYTGWPFSIPIDVQTGEEFEIHDEIGKYLLENFPMWFKQIEDSPRNKMVKTSNKK